ncbi:AP-4 complex subunit epsilon-1 [Alosa alosa]|nr:AP-4 complex subunit epsilon-1 [Alosa alosa]
MSDVVEKTLTALPGLLSLDSQTGAGKLSSTSKLGNLIRSITELTSKHDEEKLIKRELVAIKEQVSSPNTTMRQMKEMMVRSIYCEMLGYEADFSYIHAIKLAQQGAGLEKRVGYLAVSLFLNENHELLLLLVNTVLKDLQSTNLIEVCMALTVVSQMFPKDMIPAILPLVEEKLTHPKEIIRRKAVLALHKFYLIAPNQVQHIHSKFRKALCDKDPGVMAASLHIYLQMIKEGAEAYRELAGSFAAILRQVVGGKLPVEFNYHSVPAPWLQIQLLRILTLLGKDDQSTSELMYDVLDESLRRAEINHNITYAILFECVKAIYTIHPNAELMEKAAKCIGNFVLSPKINLKYLGLKALTYVVQQDANLALQHQMTIIECLDHSDRIIKRETLELLFRITNAQNVTVIVEKMLAFLRLCHEDYTIMDLVGKVAELAEKYAPDNRWFVETMSTVFSVGGDLMPPDIPTNFLRLLSEGSDSEEDDRQLRVYAVESYVSLLQTDPTHLPQRFLQVISWVRNTHTFTVFAQNSLSLEPYGLSLPISLSSCSIADRQSPTLLSISSGLSGNSTELLHRAGSGSLRLDGVKRKWGKDGYLAQREVPEEPSTPQETSTPAPQPSPQQGGALTPPSAEPSEEERDKQQLASSLFIGLSSQNSTCLMGKPEASSSQRFRRKQKNTDSASSSSGSSHSSRGANHFLYSSLLEEGPVSPIMLTQNSVAQPKHKEANSTLSEGDMPFLPAANGLAEGHDPEAPASLMLANEALSSAGGGARDSPSLMGGMELVQPCPLTPDPSHRSLSSHLPPELQNLPCSDCASLASDGCLALSCCRVHREDALVLVLLMANTGGATLLDVSVELQCPQLKVASLRGNALESLPSQSVSVCWYTLLMEEPHTHVEVTGSLSYRKECGASHTPDISASHTLDISTRLSLAHFLRPLVLSTEEYGKLWLSVSQDVKQNIQLLDPDRDPLRSSLTALQDKLQLHIVDIIGSEGIAACQLLRRGPCLLHCRVHAGVLALWLRSPVPGLPDGLLYHCQRALQER